MGSTGAVPTTIHHQATFLSSLKHSRRLKHNRSNSHLFLPKYKHINAMMTKYSVVGMNLDFNFS